MMATAWVITSSARVRHAVRSDSPDALFIPVTAMCGFKPGPGLFWHSPGYKRIPKCKGCMAATGEDDDGQ